MQNQYLEDLLHEVSLITKKVEVAFGRLNAGQLNWQPRPDEWSIAQCLDHLVKTNRQYFPILEGVAQGTRKTSFMEKLPGLPGFFGKLMLKAMDPANTKKRKTSAIFKPAASQLPASMVTDFVQHQQQLIRLIRATDHVDHEKTIVSSPISGLITLSLRDAIRILVVHEERHFMQAKRLQKAPGSPLPAGQPDLPASQPRPGNPSHQNRSDRPNRSNRPPQSNRPESADASDRPKRPPRSDRSQRPPRENKPDRAGQPPQENRSDRAERPPQENRSDRPSRPPRENRSDRADRPPQENRSDRPSRPPRESRSDRADRPPQENKSDRPSRPPRENRSNPNRSGRPKGSDRPPRPTPQAET